LNYCIGIKMNDHKPIGEDGATYPKYDLEKIETAILEIFKCTGSKNFYDLDSRVNSDHGGVLVNSLNMHCIMGNEEQSIFEKKNIKELPLRKKFSKIQYQNQSSSLSILNNKKSFELNPNINNENKKALFKVTHEKKDESDSASNQFQKTNSNTSQVINPKEQNLQEYNNKLNYNNEFMFLQHQLNTNSYNLTNNLRSFSKDRTEDIQFLQDMLIKTISKNVGNNYENVYNELVNILYKLNSESTNVNIKHNSIRNHNSFNSNNSNRTINNNMHSSFEPLSEEHKEFIKRNKRYNESQDEDFREVKIQTHILVHNDEEQPN
jgi:hypothetical protein